MKKYFEDALEKLICTSFGERGGAYPTFCQEHLKYYPDYFYKYRPGIEQHDFDMITQEYLWADVPENFSDPYDSFIHLKCGSELAKIQSWLYHRMGEIVYYSIPPKGMSPQKNGQTLKSYLAAQEQYLDTSGRYNAKKAQRLMTIELNKMSQSTRKETQKTFAYLESDEFQSRFEKAIQNSVVNVTNALRRTVKVCCLTTRRDNRNMWENYAAKYSGFVIEYEVSRVLKCPETIANLERIFPVTYYKRLPKVPLLPFIQRDFESALYNREIDILPTTKQLYKQLVSKSYDYRAEEEWRIMTSTNIISFPIISAVYAGHMMSDENLERLKVCCKKIGVPLYKQKLGIFDDVMTYEQIL